MKQHSTIVWVLVFASLFFALATASLSRWLSKTPTYATSWDKCENPTRETKGVAVFDKQLVGIGWNCHSRGGKLTVGGGPVRFRCKIIGPRFDAHYELIGPVHAPMLSQYGVDAEPEQLYLCEPQSDGAETR